MNATFCIFVGVYVLMMIFVGIVVWRRFKKRKAVMKEISAELHGEIKSGQRYTAELEGHTYHYQYYPGSKNQPSYFKIFLDGPLSGDFVLTQENAFDRFFKKLGITVEIQTGDLEFDEKFYIKSNTIEFVNLYFSDIVKRQAALELHRLGFNQINHTGKAFLATRTPFALDKNFDPGFIKQGVQQLIVLSQNIPEYYPASTIQGTPVWKVKRIFTYTVAIFLLILGMISFFVSILIFKPLDGWTMFVHSLKYSVPSFAFFTFLAVTLLKGRSNSHQDVVANFFLSLVGILFLGYGGMAVTNGYFDEGAQVRHHALVVDKWISRGRNSTNYYIKVQSWREGRSYEKFDTGRKLYYAVTVNQTSMDIYTKPGKLGYEWLVGMQPAPDQ